LRDEKEKINKDSNQRQVAHVENRPLHNIANNLMALGKHILTLGQRKYERFVASPRGRGE
jgi:hypothetical protein